MLDKTRQQSKDLINKTKLVTVFDIQNAIKTLVSVVKNLKKTLEDKLENHKTEINNYYDEHKGKMKEDCVSEIKSELNQILLKSKAHTDTQVNTVIDKYSNIISDINNIKDIKDIKDEALITKNSLSDINAKLEEIENKEPEKIEPEFIRNQLESIKIEEEKLEIEAIGFLRKELDELKKAIDYISVSRNNQRIGSMRTIFIDDETPTGTVNGVNTNFVLADTPLVGSLKVFRGGARLRVTEDYTLSDKTITFTIAPQVGEILLCDYRK